MKAIAILAMIVFLAAEPVVSGLLEALALRQLWLWFASAEYGTGPSLGAWFGFAAMLGFVINMNKPNGKSDGKSDNKSQGRLVVLHAIGKWIGIIIMLATARAVGGLLGWVGP